MSANLKKIDEAVYRAERTLVVSALLIMAVVVFLDVVHRGFAGEASKFAEVGIKLSGMFGGLPDEASPEYAAVVAEKTESLAAASPYVLFVLFTGAGFFGIRSAKRSEPVPVPTAALLAVAGVFAAYGLVRVLIWAMPNGLIWSQPMALVLTLWVGFIGASMCTYERKHLKVEAVQRFVPEKYKPALGFVSGAMTTLACLILLWLSLRYVLFNYEEYVQTEGRGGLFQGWAVPKYQGFAALPIAFTFMSVRFAARAVLAAQGKLEPPGDTLGLGDNNAAAEPDDDRPPSEVATEAMRAEPDDAPRSKPPKAAPSEIDTMTSQPSELDAVRPQSKVATDPHQKARGKSGGAKADDAPDAAAGDIEGSDPPAADEAEEEDSP